ncbi:hypothetical protein DNK55_33015 [Streptomyces sp. AC1-42T]|nr:hypothetical protein DNK55_33015 [Streptomyces sp. AC1-42T]
MHRQHVLPRTEGIAVEQVAATQPPPTSADVRRAPLAATSHPTASPQSVTLACVRAAGMEGNLPDIGQVISTLRASADMRFSAPTRHDAH